MEALSDSMGMLAKTMAGKEKSLGWENFPLNDGNQN